MFRIHRRSLRAAAVAASFAATHAARAQGAAASGQYTAAEVSKNHVNVCGWGPFELPAIDTRCVIETTATQTSSNAVLTYADVLATVDAQRKLHAKTLLHTDRIYYSFGGDSFDATANAMMWDRLQFVGPVIPHSVRLNVRMDGRVDAHEYVTSHGTLLGYFGGAEPAESLELRTPTGAYGAASARWVVPLVGSTLDFALELDLGSHLEEVPIDFATLPPCTLRLTSYCGVESVADLANTAWLDLIEGLDENGDVITSGLHVRTASGATYAVQGGTAVTATPEPAPLALVLGGLASLGVFVRRGRALSGARATSC